MPLSKQMVEALMALFPNDCRIITIEETKQSRQIAKDVCKYVMGIEEAHNRAAHSTLRFEYATK